MHWFFSKNGGKPFPEEHVKIAAKQLEEFCKMLELEGITVRRPDNIDHSFEYETPDFKSTGMLPSTYWFPITQGLATQRPRPSLRAENLKNLTLSIAGMGLIYTKYSYCPTDAHSNNLHRYWFL